MFTLPLFPALLVVPDASAAGHRPDGAEAETLIRGAEAGLPRQGARTLLLPVAMPASLQRCSTGIARRFEGVLHGAQHGHAALGMSA
jgi:hypothetical protein